MSRLGELLLKRNVISRDQYAKAFEVQQKDGGPIVAHLAHIDGVSGEEILGALERETRLPVAELDLLDPAEEVLALVPHSIASRHAVLPVSLVGSTLTLAAADPTNFVALNEVKFLTGYDIRLLLAPIEGLQKAIERLYESDSAAYQDVLSEIESEDVEFIQEEQDIDLEELERATEEAPVVKLVNALLTDAIRKNASDVHIEPYEKVLRVRFRIDGVLYEVMKPPVRLRAAIISRIKIMSSLDIAERRLPQDGRIKLRIPGRKEMDFRVSVLPTMFGEKVVLRLLDKSNLQLDMTKLGFEENDLEKFQRNIHKPYGMILVTGPTGSGKTTTLYSALSELNKTTENISTAEDPVEFNLMGINQVQVNDDIGLSFAATLRSFLRQDPDIIMVGEIRDFETAEIAVKAALTGHLVLSTLHTNDAPSTINRLLNMGIEPFLVASSLNLILAQRLARVICKECKRPAEYSTETLLDVGFRRDELPDLRLFEGAGCATCNQTGFKGRIALYEVLEVEDAIKESILQGDSAIDLKRTAIQNGMQSLRMAGLHKAKEGLTTVGELLRATMADEVLVEADKNHAPPLTEPEPAPEASPAATYS